MKYLSIVIPVYNEEAILEREMRAIISEMSKTLPDLDYEIFLVENGSRDNTKSIVEKLTKEFSFVRAVFLPVAGYGQALKAGLIQNEGNFVVVFNVDFWNVQFLKNALEVIKNSDTDMVLGSKAMTGSEDTRPLIRRLITFGFNYVLKIFFGFRGTDTHGMKLLRSYKIRPIIKMCRTEKEIFDTEFVLRAQKMGLKCKEVPVKCEEKRKTTLTFYKIVPRVIRDLIVLFFTLHLSDWQDRKKRTRFIFFTSIVLFFFVAVFYGFPDSPSPWFDEGVNLGIAKTFVQDGVYSLRLSPGEYISQRSMAISTNYPVLLPIIAVFYVFGVGLAQAKIVMFLFLCLFLLLVYKFIYKISQNKNTAMYSIALAITFLPFYGNGLGGGLGEVPGLVYFLGALFLLDSDKTWKIFVGSILLGLAASTKVFYLVLLGAVGLSELCFAIVNKKIQFKRWGIMTIGVLLPLLIWLRTLLPQGLNFGNISQTLSYYKNPYNVENTIVPNLMKFFTQSTPMHFMLLAIPLFAYLIMRIRARKINKQDVTIGLFVLLNFIWFLHTPGWYRYLFPAHLFVLVLFPVVITDIFEKFNKKSIHKLAKTIVFLLIIIQAAHLIKGRNDRLYYYPTPRKFAEELPRIVGENANIFIVDQPELWFLYDNAQAKQYMQMNPHIAFGEDFFAKDELPDYLVSGEPVKSLYLTANKEKLLENYVRSEEIGPYILFKKK